MRKTTKSRSSSPSKGSASQARRKTAKQKLMKMSQSRRRPCSRRPSLSDLPRAPTTRAASSASKWTTRQSPPSTITAETSSRRSRRLIALTMRPSEPLTATSNVALMRRTPWPLAPSCRTGTTTASWRWQVRPNTRKCRAYLTFLDRSVKSRPTRRSTTCSRCSAEASEPGSGTARASCFGTWRRLRGNPKIRGTPHLKCP